MKMSRETLEAILRRPGYSIEGVIPSTLPVDRVGTVAPAKREPDSQPALVKNKEAQPRRRGSLAVVVSLVAFRRRLLDDDNNSFKPLRDSISRSLMIDDASTNIRFQCGQIHTTGSEGTVVRIEWV